MRKGIKTMLWIAGLRIKAAFNDMVAFSNESPDGAILTLTAGGVSWALADVLVRMFA